MHKVFGIKQNVEYVDREGAYVIVSDGDLIGVVKTPKGYFLLGGGIEGNENHRDSIIRECLEEAGLTVEVGKQLCSAETYTQHPQIGWFHPTQTYYEGKVISKVSEPFEKDHEFVWIEREKIRGKMLAEMQNWALERYVELIGHASSASRELGEKKKHPT